MPSRNPNRPAPKRRDPTEQHPDWVEPKVGTPFTLQRWKDAQGRPQSETQTINRVVRQGTHEHGQGQVWTVEYWVTMEDTAGETHVEKFIWWVMYDEHRREWADARLVQDEALARGEPIYAAPSKIPPLGPVP